MKENIGKTSVDSEQQIFEAVWIDLGRPAPPCVVPQTGKPLVVQIQRADYEGDRSALKRLYNDLAPFADDKELGAKVRYWRWFALWSGALICG